MAARTGPTCGAARRNNMGPCGQPAGWHTDHPGAGRCSWHGGSAPNGVKAAAAEQAEAKARAELAKLNVRPVGNPLIALRKLAGQVVAWQETCAGLVNKLTAEEVRYSGQVGGLRAEQLRAEIGMYQDALRQAVSVLVALSKVQTDEQIAAIRGIQAAMIAAAFERAIGLAGLPLELQKPVRDEFASRLNVLAEDAEFADLREDDGYLTGTVLPTGTA